jgi:GDP-D-mannose dehydratase
MGAAKVYAHWITLITGIYDLFAVSGILFNHEARGLEFVTRS